MKFEFEKGDSVFVTCPKAINTFDLVRPAKIMYIDDCDIKVKLDVDTYSSWWNKENVHVSAQAALDYLNQKLQEEFDKEQQKLRIVAEMLNTKESIV